MADASFAVYETFRWDEAKQTMRFPELVSSRVTKEQATATVEALSQRFPGRTFEVFPRAGEADAKR